jgi:RNAse (barnase) inhibitor barstar
MVDRGEDRRGSLLRPKAPWVVEANLASDSVQGSIREAGQSGVVVEVDSADALTLDAFFVAISSAFEFPDYFGNNWEALKDCLTDLDWLPSDAYLLIFRNSERLFANQVAERASFLRIMNLAAEEWSIPITSGEWWDRPAIPFHVILDDGVSQWSPELLHDIGLLE